CSENLRKQYEEKKKSGSFIGISKKLIFNSDVRNIEFYTHGTAHSDTDLFTYLPNEGVVFTGDSVVNAHSPWMGACDIWNWIATLSKLDELNVKTVCVGHGPLAGQDVFKRLSMYFTSLRDEIGYQISQGRDLETSLSQINVAACDEWLIDDQKLKEHGKIVYDQLIGELPELPPNLMPQAFVLIGDHYHPPAYIPPSLDMVFHRIGMPARYTYNVTQLNAKNLKGVRLLVILRDGMNWPDPKGKQIFWMTEEQEKAVEEFVRNGGGFLALHNATALKRLDDERSIYRDVLGSSYNGHGPGNEEFSVKVINHNHPITKGVNGYPAIDERHTPIIHADDANILLEAVSGDKTSVNGYVRPYGKGRVCYLANGHNLEMLQNPEMQKLMTNAALWCCGLENLK
ncbi:hypothetical protein FJZ33_04220, partial [Candidatus Poribacteria bacterium]|nr:hypothetical protein [Candidatus Poribacteria bacterium]